MAKPMVSVKVTGAKELRKIARKAGRKDAQKALRAGHKAVGETVAAHAKRHTPVDSGALARSIRGRGSLSEGSVVAGGARAPYAGRLHYGDPPGRYPNGGIQAQPYLTDAVKAKLGDARDEIEELYRRVAEQLATTRGT